MLHLPEVQQQPVQVFRVSRISILTLISTWPAYMWLPHILGVTSSIQVPNRAWDVGSVRGQSRGWDVTCFCTSGSGWGSRIQMGIPHFKVARLPVLKAGKRLCVLQTGVAVTVGCLPDWQSSRLAAACLEVV